MAKKFIWEHLQAPAPTLLFPCTKTKKKPIKTHSIHLLKYIQMSFTQNFTQIKRLKLSKNHECMEHWATELENTPRYVQLFMVIYSFDPTFISHLPPKFS